MMDIQNIQGALNDVSQNIGSSFEALTHFFDDSESKKNTKPENSPKVDTLEPIPAFRLHGHVSASASSASASSASSRSAASAESDRSAFIAKDLQRKRRQWKKMQEQRDNSLGQTIRPGSMAEQFVNMVDKARADGAYAAHEMRLREHQEDHFVTKETKKDFESKVYTVKKGFDTVCYLGAGHRRVNLCDADAFWNLTHSEAL